jgi:arylsulfatase A-like enzyme
MTNAPSRRTWPLLAVAVLAVGIYAYFTIEIEPSPSDRRPAGGADEIEALAARDDTNLLFILVDTLRAERMSAYGYARDTTPFLKGLAENGIRFGWNVSQSSWTKASMASLWSSRTPLHVGVTKFDHTLSKDLVMPAEILADGGFKTVGLFRNGWVNPSFGFDQGFEKYYKPLGGYQDPQIKRMRPNAQRGGTDESMVADAIEFLRIHGRSSRWFLYVHLMDVHEYTYDKESALFGTGVSDIYDNSILREDWVISTLYDYLARLKLLDKTIVVLASDHGEAFGERGFEGHAREVFPETTETPVIISLPFALSKGIVLPTRTNNMDVWPTLLDLMGLPTQGDDIDGRSRRDEILALARGTAPPPPPAGRAAEETSVAFLDENWGVPGGERLPAVSLVDDDFRYVRGSGWNGRPYEVLLSIRDGQRKNVLDANPEQAEALREQAKVFLEQKPAFESQVIEIDEMQLDQLRALGYQLP